MSLLEYLVALSDDAFMAWLNANKKHPKKKLEQLSTELPKQLAHPELKAERLDRLREGLRNIDRYEHPAKS